MEILVVILLVFGAVSLDSATHESMEGDSATTEQTAAENQSVQSHAAAADAETINHATLQDCLLNRHDVIYRDLTRVHETDIDAVSASSCDCNGVCPDE